MSEQPETKRAGKRSLKILVCDDERNIVRLTQVNLERVGHIVTTAFNGKEALERLKVDKPDLVLLDVMMPYFDGLEVLKSIRKNPETENLPVILLTVKAQDQDISDGYCTGADLYLTKPFNPDELPEVIDRMFPE